ncbi:hypothetical protein ACFQ0M_49230 [Kitasatospora aburaviensis]
MEGGDSGCGDAGQFQNPQRARLVGSRLHRSRHDLLHARAVQPREQEIFRTGAERARMLNQGIPLCFQLLGLFGEEEQRVGDAFEIVCRRC